ncbi:MAG TPA: hypothetical protein VJ327_10550 [Patescibacteria group bacterium]|nr:hypothetical protein [Patescibacteria group bacterium]
MLFGKKSSGDDQDCKGDNLGGKVGECPGEEIAGDEGGEDVGAGETIGVVVVAVNKIEEL